MDYGLISQALHPIGKNYEPEREPFPQWAMPMPGILVVDDDAQVLKVLRMGLEAQGFDVWIATDGFAALELYLRHREAIAAVLLDICMPGLDGPQTLSRLRQFDPAVRVCFMTGNAGAYDEDELLERGAKCVFRKPFHLEEVGRVLWQVASEADCLI